MGQDAKILSHPLSLLTPLTPRLTSSTSSPSHTPGSVVPVPVVIGSSQTSHSTTETSRALVTQGFHINWSAETAGEKVLVSPRYSTSINGLPPWSTTLNGHVWTSFLTLGSSNRRPINRLWKWLVENAREPRRKIYTLGIKDSVTWVQSSLIFSSITNQTLVLWESDERWCNSVSLLVGNYQIPSTSVSCGTARLNKHRGELY